MATTVEHRAMSKLQRRTHEKLARELGHQPTLDMLLREQANDTGYAEHQLCEAFDYASRTLGFCAAVQIIAGKIAEGRS
jgi:hypothetical protein